MGAAAKLDISDALGNLDSASPRCSTRGIYAGCSRSWAGVGESWPRNLFTMRAWSSLKRPTALAR